MSQTRSLSISISISKTQFVFSAIHFYSGIIERFVNFNHVLLID